MDYVNKDTRDMTSKNTASRDMAFKDTFQRDATSAGINSGDTTCEETISWKKKIILFLTSQTISLFGSSIVQYAISWYIVLETRSGVMMTISIVCGFLPMFFLSPFAGVWADRYDRKKILVMSDSLIALSTLVVAIMFLLGYESIWLLFVISAVRGAGGAVQLPAVGAFIPQLVPQDKLVRVNGINSSIQSVIMLVSPMVSAALMSFTTLKYIFFIDVTTAFAAVMILLLFLHTPVHAKALEKQKTTYFSDMREGIAYIRKHEFLKKIFLFCSAFLIMSTPAAFLTPLQVARSFGEEVWRLSAIEIIFSVGMLLGGLLMASWGGFRNKMHSMVLSTAAAGLCTMFLGLVPNFWVYLAFMGLTGVAIPFFNTPFTVLLQQKVEESFHGRMFSIFGMISSIVMPLGMLVFGPMSDFVKIEWMLIATGIVMLCIAVMMFFDKVLITAGKQSAGTK